MHGVNTSATLLHIPEVRSTDAAADDLSIPAFLRLTREQRHAGWERWLKRNGGYTNPWLDSGAKRDWRRPQSLTDEEWAYWQGLEQAKAEAKRIADEPRFEAMRAKAKEERDAKATVKAAVCASVTNAVAKRTPSGSKRRGLPARKKHRKKGSRK
jgi:hypothetical protein